MDSDGCKKNIRPRNHMAKKEQHGNKEQKKPKKSKK